MAVATPSLLCSFYSVIPPKASLAQEVCNIFHLQTSHDDKPCFKVQCVVALKESGGGGGVDTQ